MTMNLSTYRKLFPITEKSVYLNNAAESPLNTRVHQTLKEYLQLVTEGPQNKPEVRTIIRKQLSEIFGGTADEYALVTSTGMGISIVASGYQWQKGDNVVIPMDEHWNNTFPWLALRERGVEVRLVPIGEDQRVDAAKIASMVDKNTRILSTSAVRFDTGFRTDLKVLSEIAHNKGALLMVDGIQAAGVCPMNVLEDGIDILACGGFKWLLGLPGTGFLYVNSKAQENIRPVLPGMFAAERNSRELHYLPDARCYETGTIPYSLFHAWSAGLKIIHEVGVSNIHTHVLSLTDRIIASMHSKKIEIVTPVEQVSERSAIISFTMGSETANQVCHDKLRENNVVVSLRGSQIRVSPNFFNTEEEIERFLGLL
ncbi:MAG: aminotransferase class V-fold PLP-dependent enzyme [Oceanospirillaceae bacterium]|nr:aminotransferase class V-fold PLP-dependent enzyme [Oceanospirillaceae bacterium]